MKTLKYLFISAILAGFTTTATLGADQKQPSQDAVAAGKKAKPYPLDFCLVSGEKFEGSEMKPFEMVHEGQTIKFCCKNCVKDFKKEPKKYLTKLEEEVKKQAEAKAKKEKK